MKTLVILIVVYSVQAHPGMFGAIDSQYQNELVFSVVDFRDDRERCEARVREYNDVGDEVFAKCVEWGLPPE